MIQTQKKKSATWRLWLPVVLVLALVVAGVVFFTNLTKHSVSQPIKLTALSTQMVTPFGEDVLYYDGIMLHCVTGSGSHRWSFQVGQNAGFHAQGKYVVAWSANQLYILENNGQPTYNDRMAMPVEFARVGNNYVAAFVGDRKSGTVYVVDTDGRSVDSMAVDGEMLIDIGFFSESPEMMWMLALDTTGTVPSMTMQTFRPGTLATGSATLGEQIVYKVYYYNGLLRVADTRQIRFFDYKIKQDTNLSPILTYGWLLTDARQIGRDLVQLLVPVPQMDGTLKATDIRLLTGNNDRVLHLPATCFGAELGSKSIYAFSSTHVYACKYGENNFATYVLPERLQVTRVLGMTQKNRAILASGSDVYLVQLPE